MFATRRRPLAALLFIPAFVVTGLFTSPAPAVSQVSGAVIVNGGQVRGQVAVGEPIFAPRPVIIYQPYRGRRVEVARYAPQVVFVERGHGRYGKPSSWYDRHGYRPVTLYYSDGRYFSLIHADRRYQWGGNFVPVTVWERGGRFYLPAGRDFGNRGYAGSYDGNSSREYQYDQNRQYDDGRDWDE